MTAAEEKKSIAINAIFILIIQMANAVLPFVLAPYLTKVIGVEEYGVVAFGLAAVQMACIFTDYGFGLSAVYEISRSKNNREMLNNIVTAVYICKMLLFIPVAMLFSLIPYAQDGFFAYKEFIWILLFSVFFMSLQPVWFFQGIEKMKNVTICTLISRVIFILIVLLVVKDKSDIPLIAVANGVSLLISTILSGYLLWINKYKIHWCGWKFVSEVFNNSTGYFFSRISVACYGIGSTFYLGLVSTPLQVAYYSVAEQFYRGAIAIYNPVTQALYPYMARTRNVSFFKKVLVFAIVFSVAGVVFGFLVGDTLISLLFGVAYKDSLEIYNVFMVSLLIAIPSILLGYPFLGALGDAKAANKSVIIAGLIQAIILSFSYFLNYTSAIFVAYAVLGAEMTALLYRAGIAKKHLLKGHCL